MKNNTTGSLNNFGRNNSWTCAQQSLTTSPFIPTLPFPNPGQLILHIWFIMIWRSIVSLTTRNQHNFHYFTYSILNTINKGLSWGSDSILNMRKQFAVFFVVGDPTVLPIQCLQLPVVDVDHGHVVGILKKFWNALNGSKWTFPYTHCVIGVWFIGLAHKWATTNIFIYIYKYGLLMISKQNIMQLLRTAKNMLQNRRLKSP